MKGFKIAIDGPAASGKSTICKLIAEKLNCVHIDTGLMFRVITLYLIKNKVNWAQITEENYLKLLLNNCNIYYEKNHIYCNYQKMCLEIKLKRIEIDNKVSLVASLPFIRQKLLLLQQEIIKNNPYLIMDGRDIGTIVMPNADLKIFLTANIEQRILRRVNEFKSNKSVNELQKITNNIKLRDHKDFNRLISPLKKAEDAILLDTTDINIIETVNQIHNLILHKKKLLNQNEF
ncbi:Cytidylate kinase [Candidatus Phytoplasma mali]|uniref:Cytidylate kinase n=1 Tax=Phytoplasma mali (strain AT) TaxID=482235 RepID=KCY_PHYMT|nr:(d)CMP kinase [Candidatus Phytoplasma mali]B3R0E5.1 RecName: Full=Cytidylate kinase; Short=CK; AltName: Full=Cytidine monophosphate kinase; Short=CMP kinase [Candidatus Phytoplasma mali AT]CAP18309.1 Cytidylate kinase [Candidatus Phytoplasma mali]